MKFQSNIFSSVQLTERTKNAFSYATRNNSLKNKHARAMVLVHDTLFESVLQMYEVSLEIPLTVIKF